MGSPGVPPQYTHHSPAPGSVLVAFCCCQVVFPLWCGLKPSGCDASRSPTRVIHEAPSLAGKVHPPTANFLSAFKCCFENKRGEGEGGEELGLAQTDPGTEEGPRHKHLKSCNWVITRPLLDLNNGDLKGYVKSPILSRCIWFLPASLTADNFCRPT